MASFISTYPGAIISLGVGVAFIALCVLEVVNSRRISKLASPALEYAIKKAQDESDRIITEARSQARVLVERAEADAGHLAAERAKEDEGAEHAHDAALNALRESFAAYLTQATQEAKHASEAAGTALEAHFGSLEAEALDELRKATAEMKDQFAEAMKTALASATAEAKESATAYAAARKEAVDAHIVDLVAETTKIALATGLPESVHAELVQRALEEAKTTHVI